MSVASLLSSTAKTQACLLVPKLSTTERLATSTIAGELVFDTDLNTLFLYDGTLWEQIQSSGSGGSLIPSTLWYLPSAENNPATTIFAIGSAVPLTKRYSTFSGTDVTQSGGVFTLPSDGVYRIFVSALMNSPLVRPTTGTLQTQLVNGANTVVYAEQYAATANASLPDFFTLNCEFTGQFTAGNTFQVLLNNGTNAIFSTEGTLAPATYRTCISIQKIS